MMTTNEAPEILFFRCTRSGELRCPFDVEVLQRHETVVDPAGTNGDIVTVKAVHGGGVKYTISRAALEVIREPLRVRAWRRLVAELRRMRWGWTPRYPVPTDSYRLEESPGHMILAAVSRRPGVVEGIIRNPHIYPLLLEVLDPHGMSVFVRTCLNDDPGAPERGVDVYTALSMAPAAALALRLLPPGDVPSEKSVMLRDPELDAWAMSLGGAFVTWVTRGRNVPWDEWSSATMSRCLAGEDTTTAEKIIRSDRSIGGCALDLVSRSIQASKEASPSTKEVRNTLRRCGDVGRAVADDIDARIAALVSALPGGACDPVLEHVFRAPGSASAFLEKAS